VYARVIINKSISSIIPVVVERVVAGSLICTDEHKTYTALPRFGFEHKTVCHKRNFVNPELFFIRKMLKVLTTI
jgi:hypothetical protein